MYFQAEIVTYNQPRLHVFPVELVATFCTTCHDKSLRISRNWDSTSKAFQSLLIAPF